ncbi:MAG: VOC family protein [Pirellulaceae bacterium]|nr:VOC family protein [Pirellulaceae bacterium]
MSLAVKDIQVSKPFYEKFGLEVFFGEPGQNWLIMKNGTQTIGLFQDRFEGTIMTFNPDWTHEAKETEGLTDIRDPQTELQSKGVELLSQVDHATTGPASLSVLDPDGNQVLID